MKAERALMLLLAMLVLGGCAQESTAEPLDGPARSQLRAFWVDLRATLAGTSDRSREIEDAIALCMAAQGFSYVPNPVPAESVLIASDAADWSSERNAQLHGYGFVAPDGAASGAPTADPNAEVVAAMGDAERDAYLVALYGANVHGADQTGDVAVYNAADAGCSGTATAEWGDPRSALADLPLDSIIDELGYLEEAVRIDARVVAATAAWSDCLAQSGMEVPPGDPGRLLEDLTREFDAMWDEGTAPARDELLQFADRERVLALADFRCRDRSHLLETTQDVRTGLENAFVDDHAAELEAIRVAFEEIHQ